MKKIFILLILLIFLCACANITQNPKSKVEELMNNYNKLDDNVIRNLDMTIIASDIDEDNYEYVRDAFKRQYKDLKYKIENIKEKDKKAVIKLKIEVYDYSKSKKESNNYITNNSNKFMTNNNIDKAKIEKYIYKNYLNTNDRITHNIKINLVKNNNKWNIKEMNTEVIEKIHGTFSY